MNQVGKITQLTTTSSPYIRRIEKPKKIDYNYIRLRTQTLMSEINLTSLTDAEIRRISICMEDIAQNELERK